MADDARHRSHRPRSLTLTRSTTLTEKKKHHHHHHSDLNLGGTTIEQTTTASAEECCNKCASTPDYKCAGYEARERERERESWPFFFPVVEVACPLGCVEREKN